MNESIPIRNFAFKKNLEKVIPPINYLTHNLYSYPAKFIPHVPYYVLSKFIKKDDAIVLDPFAGSSSTAVEALCLGNNSISLDINPLTDFLTEIKTQRITFDLIDSTPTKLDEYIDGKRDKPSNLKDTRIDLMKFIEEMKKSESYFCPKWKNIDHWYPEEFKKALTRIWGFLYSIETDYPQDFVNLAKLSALYVSRYLSYGARDVPKLFRSKRREKQVEELRKRVKKNPKIPYNTYQKIILKYFNQMIQLTEILKKKNIFPEYEEKMTPQNIRCNDPNKRKVISLGNTDIVTYEFPINEEFIDIIITSPPYIYAQEYIRSTKLDLYWMNLADDAHVRELTKKELGTKKGTDLELVKNKLKTIKTFKSITKSIEKTERKKYGKNGKYSLQTSNYFYDMYLIIEKTSKYLRKKGIFGLFIGNPTVLGHQVPCHRIFSEFFLDLGFNIVEFGYDEIISPRLLKGRQNLSPDGMKAEWLIIAQK